MKGEVTLVTRIFDEMLFRSRAGTRIIKLELAPHDPADILANFNVGAQVRAERHGVHFPYSHEGSGQALCEPRWVRRVLLNLLSNAINASPPGGNIRLRSRLTGEPRAQPDVAAGGRGVDGVAEKVEKHAAHPARLAQRLSAALVRVGEVHAMALGAHLRTDVEVG